MSTTKGIMDNIPPSLLDTPVEDIDIAKLAREMMRWQELAPFLGLTPAEEQEIVERYQDRLQLQKREALRKWKEKLGREATYRSLITILYEQDRADLADTLKAILLASKKKLAQSGVSSSCPPTKEITDIFHDYLVDCYSSLPHPSSLQWPTSMTSDQMYVELKLLDVPLRNADDHAEVSTPITLKSLFSAGNSKAKRKLILIEGVAGAGKTTLTWYAFKEWAEGRLFEDIKLLIYVDVSDRTIHSATNLSDIIPYLSEKIRTKIAEAIGQQRGMGVCFWFDGCDEAPPELWKSFLYRFICGSRGRAMLPSTHIILTSRPGLIPLELTSTLTGKVVVKGLTSIDDYFVAYFPDQGAQLIEALKMKPELYSLCHLPLHASILAYIYDTVKDNLPTTRTDLFDPLIQNLIFRHVLSCTPHEHPDLTNFPGNLPDDIRSSFNKLSQLAFENIIHGRKVFDRNSLTKCGLNNGTRDSLGFLRACIRFTMFGSTEQFSFTHLSFQEFLAALYISQMDEAKQVVAIKIVFKQNPTSPVLAFYAGLTKLRASKVQKIYFETLTESNDTTDIVRKLCLTENEGSVDLACDPRRRLLCLMNGLYEAQNQDLFAHVNLDCYTKDRGDNIMMFTGNSHLRRDARIFISHMLLYPTDCLALGYFTRHACSRTKDRVYLDLTYAVIGDIEIKALMQELHKPSSSHYVYLDMGFIFFSRDSLNALSTVFNPQSCISGFDTSIYCFLDQQRLALKYLVEGVANSNCRQLTLCDCSTQSLHYFILMLSCRRLCYLGLKSSFTLFSVPGAMRLFSEALKYSELLSLNLSSCHIDDESLMLLAEAVCYYKCPLVALNIDNNQYTENGLTSFFTIILLRFTYLIALSVDHYNDKHRKIVKEINKNRRALSNTFPPLTVDSLSKRKSQNQETQERYKAYKTLISRYDLAKRSPHH